MSITVKGSVSKIVMGKIPNGRLVSALQASSFILEGAYKEELTVDRGGLVRNTTTQKVKDGYKVLTRGKADNGGYDYALAVALGTGRYKGAGDYGKARENRVRNSNFFGFGTRAKMEEFFGHLAKLGVKFSIKPNKFHERAEKKAKPDVIKFYEKQLKALSNEQTSVN